MVFELWAVGACSLFVPAETEIVRTVTGDDIIVAIAIDIVSVHFGAPVSFAEGDGVRNPTRGQLMRQGLLKPALRMKQILSPIAIDVSNSQAMTESLGGHLF